MKRAKGQWPDITPLERFWSKVDVFASNEPIRCWEWLGGKNAHGYGTFCVTTQTGNRLAHRVSWEFMRGPIAPGVCVLHRCDNPGCVRPSHLFIGTQADNMADMIAKGRRWMRAPDLRGTKNPASKLTEDNVRAIRAATGRQQDIADSFGVSKSLVAQVRRREIWKHIP